MAWYYNGIRIFVTDTDETSKQIIARLQPVNAPTILHFFGYENPIVKVTCKVVGETDKTALLALRATGLSYTLSGAGIDYGDFALNSITFKRDPCIKQSLRGDLPDTSSVYSTDLELYLDV